MVPLAVSTGIECVTVAVDAAGVCVVSKASARTRGAAVVGPILTPLIKARNASCPLSRDKTRLSASAVMSPTFPVELNALPITDKGALWRIIVLVTPLSAMRIEMPLATCPPPASPEPEAVVTLPSVAAFAVWLRLLKKRHHSREHARLPTIGVFGGLMELVVNARLPNGK